MGLIRSTRFVFWKYLHKMYKHNRGGIGNFLTFAAFMEHFLPYRKLVKKEIEASLKARVHEELKVMDPKIELSKTLESGVEWYKAS